MAAASVEQSADARRETRADIADAVMMAAKGIMVAVVALIMLGALFSTSIVANPAQNSDPTDRIVNETQTISASGTVEANVSASFYYDDSPHEETVVNTSNGAELTEGTDYEWYTNGTLENLQSKQVTVNVTYSVYQKNTFQQLTTKFANYGEIAFIMIGLGLIALGATVAFGYFGEFGAGRGGR